jgi:hypothetical protein
MGKLRNRVVPPVLAVYIHPLVKVIIIFPTSFFCPAVAPADWPGNARRDPGKSLWGQK